MIKFPKNKRIVIISSLTTLTLLTGAVIAADPGSSGDPLITLSYFEQQLDELKEDLTKLVETKEDTKNDKEEIIESKPQEIDTSAFIFKIENLKAGSTLKCGEGTEFIIRTGEMKAVASASGGLSDVTEGTNIDGDKIVPKNHHIVVPRDDGRGLSVVTGGTIMIKGNYEIIEKTND